jgi:hypothetical protein
MRKNRNNWRVPLAGALLFTTAVSAETDTYVDGKNKVTLSVGVGLNISGNFKGVGGLNASAPRLTPDGKTYNYNDGYVFSLPAFPGPGLTWYLGYDNSANQVNRVGFPANTIEFDNTSVTGIPSEQSGGSNPYLDVELAYDRELFVKEDWHNTSFGLEAAVHYMPISFNGGGTYSANVTQVTDAYSFTPGTSPPTATPGNPYQGTLNGPGFLLNFPAIGSTTTSFPGSTFTAHEHFDGNFFGFRLGPYVEYPFTDKLSLHLSAGLAVGLLDDRASWQETLALSGGGGTTTTSGSGDDLDVLWGGYVSLQAQWQLNQRWGVEVGGQFQDLGKYDHNFSGREVELDFSRAIFVHAGVSYSF